MVGVSDEILCAAVVEASSLFIFFFLIVFSVKFPPWEGFPLSKGEVGFPKSDFSLSQRNLLQMSYLEAVLIMSFSSGIFLQTMGIDPSWKPVQECRKEFQIQSGMNSIQWNWKRKRKYFSWEILIDYIYQFLTCTRM